MADGTHKTVKLNVRVPPDKKQEWKDALDDGETLSSLVRRSVDREINDEYVSQEPVDRIVGSTDRAEVDLSAVMARFDDLQKIDTFASAEACRYGIYSMGS